MASRAGSSRPVPSGTLLVKDIETLATFNEELGEIKKGAIYVKGNVIEWVGKTDSIPAEYASADTIISLPDRVLIPGLVNTHHHMFQCLTRCIAQDSKLFGWLTTLYHAWVHLTGQDVYVACKLAMAELILSGCTTTSDHLYIYPNDVKLEDSIRAAREIGIRFHPTRGAMSLGESKGGLPPDSCTEDESACLTDMQRLIEEFHDNSRYSMLRVGLAPCAPFNVTNDLMLAAARLARKYPGVRLHTHLAENQEDIDFSLKVYGCRPGQYIKNVEWEGDDVWFAHCCMLDDSEAKQFADKGIGIAHCPSSNLRLASGIAPVRRLLDSGVNIGMGVDGTASNDSGHMLQEVRLALLLQRAGGSVEGMEAREALRVGISGGARNLGRDDIGQIAPGFAADFVAWRTDSIGFAGAGKDPVAGLLYCTPSIGSVDLSVINGDVVVRDGELLTLDLKALIKEHMEHSERLCAHLPPWWKTGKKP
ncbi:5'-deoxyadenosine deaminase [Coccomyxa sp. Obi]|nr:5'-deoxyadenosine deaminase [Coccomyxa sp. Obi]